MLLHILKVRGTNIKIKKGGVIFMDRAFKGVWIPAKVWLDKELTLTEKVFLVEISSLDGINGCYAGNTHFMTFSGLSKGRCSGVIKALKTKGYINIKMIYKNDNKTVERRIIKVNEDKFEGKAKVENIENSKTSK